MAEGVQLWWVSRRSQRRVCVPGPGPGSTSGGGQTEATCSPPQHQVGLYHAGNETVNFFFKNSSLQFWACSKYGRVLYYILGFGVVMLHGPDVTNTLENNHIYSNSFIYGQYSNEHDMRAILYLFNKQCTNQIHRPDRKL